MTIISPIQKLQHPLFSQHNLHVFMKRDDLIHPVISGNKWRKLLFNIEAAKASGASGVLSFGGAYSNHIHALAYACKINSIPSKAIIRGEPHYANNATLTQAAQWGMELHFVDRVTYRLRYEDSYLASLKEAYPGYYIVPEGGSNALAVKGVSLLMDELKEQATFDSLFVPVGSGGTLAGIISGDDEQHQLYGVCVLKQGEYLKDSINALLPVSAKNHSNWKLLTGYHGGGYGKFTTAACQKIQDFSQQTQIPLEPIYSGKMIIALLALIEQGHFPSGHRIMLIHTGGLQGLEGLAEQKRIDLSQWLLPSKIEQ